MSLILVHITYPVINSVTKPAGVAGPVKIRTNAKPEMVAELVDTFLQSCHVGQGRDLRPAEDHEVFDLRFALCLGHVPKDPAYRIIDTGDRWATKSNCGNYGLEAGILLEVLRLLDKNEVEIADLDDSSFTE